jgi:cell division protein FtsB
VVPEEEQRPPSKLSRFLRLALLWLVGLSGVFALGVGVTWFTKVNSLQSEIEALRAEIETIQKDAADELDALRAQHRTDLETYQEDLVAAELRISLINALVDVASARVALGQGNIVGVRAALAGTDDRLATLQQEFGGDGVTAVEALREQLASALGALSGDPIDVEQELEQLTANLLVLERSLFSD